MYLQITSSVKDFQLTHIFLVLLDITEEELARLEDRNRPHALPGLYSK